MDTREYQERQAIQELVVKAVIQAFQDTVAIVELTELSEEMEIVVLVAILE